jgi:Ca-activated chloride channel family protein
MSHPYREEPPFDFGALEAGGAALPVRRIDIHARVSGVHAHVSLEQHYVNDRASVLEVIYVFPLPALGAVSSYTFTVDGVATRGTLHERLEARAIYDQAIAQGKSASTLEEDRPEVMTVRVGNLQPGSTASVRIGLDLILPITDDAAVLRLPLLVGARYVPGEPIGGRAGDGTHADTLDVPDASRVTPPVANDPGVRVYVVVEAFDATDVTATHPLDIERKSDRLRIRLTEVVPDGDIVLRFPLAARDSALFVPDPTGDRGTLVVTSCSMLPPSTLPLDVAVLLDHSGSMEGEKLALARRAAAGIVEGLTPRDRVLAVAFDHDLAVPLGHELVPATARNRRRAIELFDTLQARGGTEIARPLQLAAAAFETDPPEDQPRGFVDRLLYKRPDRRRAIVLVTDGQVANEDQLVQIAARSEIPVLAVAIGVAANEGLCRRLASTTDGGCERAEAPELLAAALDRTLRRLLAPVLEDLDVSLDDAVLVPGSRSPRRAPRAIPGVPAVIAARVTSRTGAWKPESLPRHVELHAIDPEGKPMSRTIPVETVDLPSLRRVWARLRIRDLEDQIAASEFPDGLRLEDELVETSLAYGVLSRYTAFVAVDPREREQRAPRERVVQPVIATERRMTNDISTKTRAGTLRGKFSHLSPEQCKGLRLGPTSDVFGLAVVLFELATLERLFSAESELGTLVKIIEGKVPPMPPAFAAIEPILRRALSSDPNDRYPDGTAFARALAELPADRSGLAELASNHARPRKVPGPIAARTGALWVTEMVSHGWDSITFAATYAGPLAHALPDAVVRIAGSYADGPMADPLPLAHPNVARVLGVIASPRAQVIEYIPGPDLLALTRALHEANTRLTVLQLTAIAQDAAAALAAVHAVGELVLDVTPTSFVLSAERCVLVSLPAAKPGMTLPVLPVPLRGLGKHLP